MIPKIDLQKTALLSLPQLEVDSKGDAREYYAHLMAKYIDHKCYKCTFATYMGTHSVHERKLNDIIPCWVQNGCNNPTIKLFYAEKTLHCKNCNNFSVPHVSFVSKNEKATKRFYNYVSNLALKYSYSKVSKILGGVISAESVGNILEKWIRQYENDGRLYYNACEEMALLNLTVGGEPSCVLFGIYSDEAEDRIFDIWKKSEDLSSQSSPLHRIINRGIVRTLWIEHDCNCYPLLKNWFPNAKICISKNHYLEVLAKSLAYRLGINNLSKPTYRLVFSTKRLSPKERDILGKLMKSDNALRDAYNMFANAIIAFEAINHYKGDHLSEFLDTLPERYPSMKELLDVYGSEMFPFASLFNEVEIRQSFSDDVLRRYNSITDSMNHAVNKKCKFEAMRARILYAEEALDDYRRVVEAHLITPPDLQKWKKGSEMFVLYNAQHMHPLKHRWYISPDYLYKYTDDGSGLHVYRGIPFEYAIENLKRIEKFGIRQHQFFWDMNDKGYSYHSNAWLALDEGT